MNQRDDTPGNESGERGRESNGSRDFYPGSHGFDATTDRSLGSAGSRGRERSSNQMQSPQSEPEGQYEREARDQGQQRSHGGHDSERSSDGRSLSYRSRQGGGRWEPARPGEPLYGHDYAQRSAQRYYQRGSSQGRFESDRYRPVTEEWEAARGYGGEADEGGYGQGYHEEGRAGGHGESRLGRGYGAGRYSPERSSDNRFSGYGAHHYGESQYGEGGYHEAGEGRHGEGQHGEARYGEGRYGEGRRGEGRYDEGRYGEGRYGEGGYGPGRRGQGHGPYREGQYRLARRYGWEAGASQPYYGPRAYWSDRPSWQDQYGFGQRTYGRDPRSESSRTRYREGASAGFPRDQYGHEHSSEQLFNREPFAGSEEPRYYGTGAAGWGGPGFTGGAYGYGSGPRDQRSLEDEYSDESALSYEQGRAGQDYGRYGSPYRNRPFAPGPKGYQRSDERLKEDISERLMEAHHIDSSEVTVDVRGAKVILEGVVPSRHMKHAIEDLVDACPGVQDIENRVRVASPNYQGSTGTSQAGSQSATATSQGARGTAGAPGTTGTSGTTGASGTTSQSSAGTSASPLLQAAGSQSASGSPSSSQTGTGSSGNAGSTKSK